MGDDTENSYVGLPAGMLHGDKTGWSVGTRVKDQYDNMVANQEVAYTGDHLIGWPAVQAAGVVIPTLDDGLDCVNEIDYTTDTDGEAGLVGVWGQVFSYLVKPIGIVGGAR